MTCSNCQEALTPGAKFCSQCGTKVECLCSACHAELLPGAKFCSQCGTPVAGAPTAPAPAPTPSKPTTASLTASEQAEIKSDRRVVTVLFTDVSGFTAMSEKLDPEEVTEIGRASCRERVSFLV
mgnify:CR=1 FL=1